MILSIICISLCVLLAGIFIFVSAKSNGKNSIITKTIASFGFVVAGILSTIGLYDNYIGFSIILIGLLLGMVGDIILSLNKAYPSESSSYLIMGICSFALGHGCYIAGISIIASSLFDIVIPLAIGLGCTPLAVVIILLCSKAMKLNFGKFQLPVICYTFILSFTAIYAIALSFFEPRLWIFAIGISLILISDIILSMVLFKQEPKEIKDTKGNKDSKDTKTEKTSDNNLEKSKTLKEVFLHTIYYLGQISIVAFMFFFFTL